MAAPPGAASAVARGERGKDVRLTVQEAAKKLSLWHTATFRPILTHGDLEPILTAAGFVALPPAAAPETEQHKDQEQEQQQPGATVEWREYAFLGSGGRNAVAGWMGPRLRMPYPRVDALHLRTYQAFLAALEVNLGALRVANLFHVRCMPVTTKQDRVFHKVLRAMRNDQDGIIVYRDGTLDNDVATTLTACNEHATTMDVGYHVIPGNPCSNLICYLRHAKIHGNSDEEETCKDYPAYIDVVRLKDLFPPRPCRNLLV